VVHAAGQGLDPFLFPFSSGPHFSNFFAPSDPALCKVFLLGMLAQGSLSKVFAILDTCTLALPPRFFPHSNALPCRVPRGSFSPGPGNRLEGLSSEPKRRFGLSSPPLPHAFHPTVTPPFSFEVQQRLPLLPRDR